MTHVYYSGVDALGTLSLAVYLISKYAVEGMVESDVYTYQFQLCSQQYLNPACEV